MLTSISVDVSSELSRERIEDVAARDPSSPAGTGRLPDRITTVRARNLPVDLDVIDADRDEIIPFRSLDAPTVGGLDVDPSKLLISTSSTSGTSLRLLLEGEQRREPSSRVAMTVPQEDPEAVADGGGAASDGVLVGLSNDQLLGGLLGAVGAAAAVGIATDRPAVGVGAVTVGAVGVAAGVGAAGRGET